MAYRKFFSHNLIRYILSAVIALPTVLFIGCSKIDSPYYNYNNTSTRFDGNAISFLQSQPGIYDSLLFVLGKLPNIVDILNSNADLTCMLPSNASFSLALQDINEIRKIQNKVPVSLAVLDSANLDTLVSRYILPGQYLTDTLSQYVDGLNVPDIKYAYPMHLKYIRTNASGLYEGGPQVIQYSDTKESIFNRYWVNTTTTSVNLHMNNNTIIHVLSSGHEFGFGEFVTRFNK